MKVCIVGLAKSGTSALYTAVRNELPEHTKCVFEPRSAQELEYVLEGDTDALTKIMFTSLRACKYDSSRFDKNVFIFRDPRDIIVSSMLYKFNRLTLINNKKRFKKMLKMFEQKENDPSSISMVSMLNAFGKGEAEFIRHKMTNNYRNLLNYAEKTEGSFTVKYENFVENNVPELQDYLGLKIEKPDKLDGWIGKINRKGASGDRRHWMLEEDVEFFSSRMNGILKRMNYDTDWCLADPQIIDKEHCSQYILRLAEARKMDPNIKSSSNSSFEFLSSAAKDGKRVAVFKLGLMYLRGEDCEKDLKEAEKLLTRATKLNHRTSAFWLGECLRQQKKYQQAVHFFELAAQDGFSRGYFKIGLMYERNRHLINPELSRSYFEKGALLGDKKCREKLLELSK